MLALKALVKKWMFNRGQSGKLASRLVLLLAKDTYVCKKLVTTWLVKIMNRKIIR
jgi:hypothetical protein